MQFEFSPEQLSDFSTSEMEVKKFGHRQIIDDYMQQLEDQEKQMDKQTLLRVIKKKPGDQIDRIKGFDEDWDAVEQIEASTKKGKKDKKKGSGKSIMKHEILAGAARRKQSEEPSQATCEDLLFDGPKPEVLSLEEWALLISGERPLASFSKDRLRQSIVKGLPQGVNRGQVWCLLCDYEQDRINHNQELYQKLLDMENHSQEYLISKDIYRTLPDTKLFISDYKQGGNTLFNVLKAYTCYDNSVGYVQGMNYLAAILLIEIQEEIKVFWCLFALLFKRNWRMIYDINTPKLMNLLSLINDRLSKDDPALLNHLKEQDLSLGAAFSPIFITLFIYQVPIPIATRIFECFILDGEIALIRVLLRMLYCKRDRILELKECELLTYLRSGMIVECVQEMEIEELISY